MNRLSTWITFRNAFDSGIKITQILKNNTEKKETPKERENIIKKKLDKRNIFI